VPPPAPQLPLADGTPALACLPPLRWLTSPLHRQPALRSPLQFRLVAAPPRCSHHSLTSSLVTTCAARAAATTSACGPPLHSTIVVPPGHAAQATALPARGRASPPPTALSTGNLLTLVDPPPSRRCSCLSCSPRDPELDLYQQPLFCHALSTSTLDAICNVRALAFFSTQ
jgi:hypothetical protein